MFTRDEILSIDAYCDDNGVSRAAYLRDLGRSQSEYNNSRRRFFNKRKNDVIGDVTALNEQEQVVNKGSGSCAGGFLPIQFTRETTPVTTKRSRSQRKRDQELANNNTLLIQIRTPSGTELSIQGQINIEILKEIIHASGGGLQNV